jgi:hypothetical protein
VDFRSGATFLRNRHPAPWQGLVENVAFHMGLRLERNAQAPDRSDDTAAHNYILGRNTARHLRLVAEQKRAATDVALNLAVDAERTRPSAKLIGSTRRVLAELRDFACNTSSCWLLKPCTRCGGLITTAPQWCGMGFVRSGHGAWCPVCSLRATSGSADHQRICPHRTSYRTLIDGG